MDKTKVASKIALRYPALNFVEQMGEFNFKSKKLEIDVYSVESKTVNTM